jgi:CRISPR-associated endoribonuclease Cas6
MRKIQPVTGETVDMAGASMVPDPDPVVDGLTDFIEAFALTPILASRISDRRAGRWHSDVRDFDISATVSARLSTIAGRPVQLFLEPDALYLSGRGTHATRVDLRTNGSKPVVLVGLTFPFTLSGLPEDLRLAWYAGLGERTRSGFGFFGGAA